MALCLDLRMVLVVRNVFLNVLYVCLRLLTFLFILKGFLNLVTLWIKMKSRLPKPFYEFMVLMHTYHSTWTTASRVAFKTLSGPCPFSTEAIITESFFRKWCLHWRSEVYTLGQDQFGNSFPNKTDEETAGYEHCIWHMTITYMLCS